MTEFDIQLQVADWEGFVDRRKALERREDSYRPDPLIIAGDEGMFDRRVEIHQLSESLPHVIEPNK